MVLVDTSVWIRSLAGEGPYLEGLGALLDLDEAASHDLVYGELLVGDRGGRQKLLSAYERLQHCVTVRHGEVVAFVRAHRLHGRGVGWVDIHLLASTLAGRMLIWTADAALVKLAHEFHVDYQPER